MHNEKIIIRKVLPSDNKDDRFNELISDSINKKVNFSDIIKVKDMGNYIETVYSDVHCQTIKNCPIRKKSKTEYYDGNGNLKTFNTQLSVEEYEKRLRTKMKYIRDFILKHFYDTDNVLFITLTYSTPMYDTKELNNDFKNFIKRIKRVFPPLVYIAVAQIQLNGNWHWHMLIKFKDSVSIPYNAFNTVKDKWKLGFTYVDPVQNIERIRFYMTNYKVDIPLSDYPYEIDCERIETKEFINENGEKTITECVIGGGIMKYPYNFKIMRHSKELEPPYSYSVTNDELPIFLEENGFELIGFNSYKIESIDKHYLYSLYRKNNPTIENNYKFCENIKKDDPDGNQNHLTALPVEGNTFEWLNSTTSNAESQIILKNDTCGGQNENN